MNKPENKLTFSVLATLTTGLALVYTFIMFHRIVFAVVGVGILFLISAYVLTQNIIAYIAMRNKSMNVQIKNYMDDISHQIETMSGAQTKLGKATFLYTKQAAEKVATLENNYSESQAALYKNLSSISNTQNKATKLMIKYDMSNTTKLISTIKDMRNHLSETMVQGFDQIQPNNDDVIAALNDIVAFLKSQPHQVNEGLSIQLNNVAHELQNISTSIQQVQVPTIGVSPAFQTSVQPEMSDSQQVSDAAPEIAEATVPSEPVIPESMETVIEEPDNTQPVMDEVTEESSEEDSEPIIEESPVMEENPPMVETVSIEESTTTETTDDSSATALGIEGKSSNDMLSADEIAALFAAADPAPKKEEPPVEEAVEEDEEPFTPTFTVVGKSTEPDDEPEEPAVTDDPNRQLSADEIAALFAAADPTPKKEEPAVENITPAAPIADDPNRQLTPDEIAALFAASEPTPKSDEEARLEEQKMDEALAAQAEAAPTVTPVSDDPNRQLTPDEIAALFASLG